MYQNKKTGFPEEFIDGLNKISSSKEIADCFNTYFTDIGSTLASKITPTEKHFTDYLHDSNSSSFLLTPTDFVEVTEVRTQIKNGTSCGFDDISSSVV